MVADYLRKRGAPEHIVKSGLGGLVRSWERTVDEIETGYKWGLEEWLNDLDVRTLVFEIVTTLPGEVVLGLMRRLNLADWRFMEATVKTQECVWGEENAKENHWSRNTHWWLYRMPPGADIVDPRD